MTSVLTGVIRVPRPDPPILVFFVFFAFFRFAVFLAFFGVFPFFSKDFKGSAERKILAFFGGSSLFLPKKAGDWSVRVSQGPKKNPKAKKTHEQHQRIF